MLAVVLGLTAPFAANKVIYEEYEQVEYSKETERAQTQRDSMPMAGDIARYGDRRGIRISELLQYGECHSYRSGAVAEEGGHAIREMVRQRHIVCSDENEIEAHFFM